jgi:hypothetical protein
MATTTVSPLSIFGRIPAELPAQWRTDLRCSRVRPSSYVETDHTLRVFQSIEVNCSFDGPRYSDFLCVLGNDGWAQYDWHLIRVYDDGRPLEILQRSQDGWGSSTHALKAGLNAVID